MLIMMYVPAECEGNFSLHLHACCKMMPYFVVPGHVNCAQYGLCYLRTIHKLPETIYKLSGIVLKQFLKGEHIVRHQDGHWNEIWTDMMIESTYIRHGKGPGGIKGTGTTTRPRSVHIWSNSLPSCNDLLNDFYELRGRYPAQKIVHKQEAKERMIADIKTETY